jgi:hypothetical protein
MSDPNEPRVATPAEAPPSPPAGEAARRDVLEGHFRLHSGGYTRFALEQAARAAGYSDNDIAAAWSRIDMEEGGKAPAGRAAAIAKFIILVLYVATFAIFVGGSDMSQRTYGLGVAILAVTLVVTGIISLLVVGRAKVVSRNPSAAVAGLLALPFILLFIVAGLCVATTGPTFIFTQPGFALPTPAPLPPEEGAPPEPAQSDIVPAEPAPSEAP